MDKNTLSNYGWIVICVLVLAVMIALASPFGNYVRTAVENTTEGLFNTNEKSLNTVGLTAESQTKYYYSTLEKAILDANNHTIQNADTDKENAVADISVGNITNNYTINILNDCEIKNITDISNTYVINLNGKTVSFSSQTHFNILSDTSLTLKNGTLQKIVNNELTENIICAENATIIIDKILFNTNNKNGIMTCNNITNSDIKVLNSSINIDANQARFIYCNNSNTTVQNVTADLIANEKSSMFIYITCTDKNNINISNSNIKTESKSGSSYGVYTSSSNLSETNFTDVNILSISGTNYARAMQYYGNSLKIDGGKYYGMQTEDISSKSMGIITANVQSVIIEDGEFVGYTGFGAINSTNSLIINGGSFIGIHSGAQILSKNAQINGGYFESSWHGGLYIASETAHIKNTTSALKKYSELKASTLFDEYYSQYLPDAFVTPDGNLYAALYIGGNKDYVSNIYMDNCKIIWKKYNENARDTSIVMNMGYNNFNQNLYISNMDIQGDIRVDCGYTDGIQASLYIGKNVSYNNIVGTPNIGFVDTTTFINESFE